MTTTRQTLNLRQQQLLTRGDQVGLGTPGSHQPPPRQATTRWRARGATSRTRTTMKRRNSDPRCAPPRHSPRTPAAAPRTRRAPPDPDPNDARPRAGVPTFLPPSSDDDGLTERPPAAPQPPQSDRESIVFLIDASPAMFRPAPASIAASGDNRVATHTTAGGSRSFVDVAVDCARSVLPLAHRIHPERPPGRRLLRHDERARNRRRRRRRRGRARERLGRAAHERPLRETHTGPRRPGGRRRKPATQGQDRRRRRRRKRRRRRRRESNPRRRVIVLRRPPPSAPRREGDAQRPRPGRQGSKEAPALHQPRRAARGARGRGGRTRAHQRVA